jgi:lipopolysaccharide biosynthesis glycosyltransferase
MDYSGWAIFADGDMVCQADISELWALRDDSKAVQVVKHDYQTKASQNQRRPTLLRFVDAQK